MAENVKARFRGEGEPYADRRKEDKVMIERWAEAKGVDLENEAQRAKQKLRNVDRP